VLEVKPRNQVLGRKDNNQILYHRLGRACRGVDSRGHDAIQVVESKRKEIQTVTALVDGLFLHGGQNVMCRRVLQVLHVSRGEEDPGHLKLNIVWLARGLTKNRALSCHGEGITRSIRPQVGFG